MQRFVAEVCLLQRFAEVAKVCRSRKGLQKLLCFAATAKVCCKGLRKLQGLLAVLQVEEGSCKACLRFLQEGLWKLQGLHFLQGLWKVGGIPTCKLQGLQSFTRVVARALGFAKKLQDD